MLNEATNTTAHLFDRADILLPKIADKSLYSLYSVVACDQYTSEIEYWNSVANATQNAISTFNMIFPEAYFKTVDSEGAIKKINAAMGEYLEKGIFECHENSFFYVKRKMKNGCIRNGLVGKVDLEQYDFSVGSTSPIRATEGTVLDRIPPRVKIRRDAPLELPHIMLLIDDPQKQVIEPIERRLGELEPVYSFDLMQDSGAISGYKLDSAEADRVSACLSALFSHAANANPSLSPLNIAVGDGNHSLATARQCYLDLKAEIGDKALAHPARYALAELVNLHDSSLEFEAIHRVCFAVDPDKLLAEFKQYYSVLCLLAEDAHKQQVDVDSLQNVAIVTNGAKTTYYIQNPTKSLAVGSLQDFLDDYIANHGGECDYIHGEDVVIDLSTKPNTIGFLLPCMKKSELFTTVINDGALPRKTFSMGEACDKRFYLEARKIK